jgi:hypothetical protein
MADMAVLDAHPGDQQRMHVPDYVTRVRRTQWGRAPNICMKVIRTACIASTGTNQPEYIGHAISSGCIRMTSEDVIDLYKRVKIGTTVIVLAPRAAAHCARPGTGCELRGLSLRSWPSSQIAGGIAMARNWMRRHRSISSTGPAP